MGVLLVLRSHFPPQPVDKFFGGWEVGCKFCVVTCKNDEPVLWE